MQGLRERLLRRGDYIRGSFVKPERIDGYIVGVNPGDRSDTLGRFPFSESSVDQAVQAAGRGAVVWRRCNITERATAIRRLREKLSEFQERLATLLTRETGRPLWEARQEVVSAIRAVDLLLEDGLTLLAPLILDERDARSDYRPRGVVAVLAPFIQPLLIPTVHVVAALLAGNSVVLKPSKFTPGVGQAIAELVDQCRLPRGVFNLVQGSGSVTGQRLSTHDGLDALVFSGSFNTAMSIRRATFDRPELPTAYHCGGKGCGLVFDSGDLDRAVYETVTGAFLSAGQRHDSTGRVIVTEGVFDEFCEQLVRRTQALRVGYGFEPNTFMGPVISDSLRARYRRYGRLLESRGHTPLLEPGNREIEGKRGFYVNPSVHHVRWNNGHAFLNDEPPGPTLLVYRVSSWEEGVALHNKLSYRVRTSVFIHPQDSKLPEIKNRLKTGALLINRGTHAGSMRLPSVGLGRASNGVPGGVELLRFLSTPRSLLLERRPFDTSEVAPGVNWDSADDLPDLSESLVPDHEDAV